MMLFGSGICGPLAARRPGPLALVVLLPLFAKPTAVNGALNALRPLVFEKAEKEVISKNTDSNEKLRIKTFPLLNRA
jgi:hypothetical protein